MALSDNIKSAREKQGISQEFIADKLGVSRQAVSKWETGQAEPSTKNLLQLAELLKIDANILLNESKERQFFAKENIEQKGIRTILNKKHTILLTASCAAQMAIFCVNPGQVNASKFILGAVSGVFMVLLLVSIWFNTGTATRSKLYLRILLFVLAFQCVMHVINHFLGGLIALIACILFLVSLLKVGYSKNNS